MHAHARSFISIEDFCKYILFFILSKLIRLLSVWDSSIIWISMSNWDFISLCLLAIVLLCHCMMNLCVDIWEIVHCHTSLSENEKCFDAKRNCVYTIAFNVIAQHQHTRMLGQKIFSFLSLICWQCKCFVFLKSFVHFGRKRIKK